MIHSILQLRIEDINESEANEMSFFYYSFCFCLAEFSRPNPVLFARFIPNLLPASHCDQLPNLILGGSHVTRGACYYSGVLQGESE